MSRLIVSLLAFAFAIISLAFLPHDLSAQAVGESRELSAGRVRKNLGEGPANVAGFEKVRVYEDTAQPGAAWATPPGGMPAPMFCTLLKGELTVQVEGEGTKTYRAGDSWVCHVGQKTQAKSTGAEPSVMRMHWLLRAGQR